MKVKKDIAAVFDRFCSSDLYSRGLGRAIPMAGEYGGQGNIHESISIEGLELESSWKDGIAGMGMGAKLGNGLIRIGMNIVRRPTGFRW